VAHRLEVALAQAEKDRPVELRVAADEVLLVGREARAVLVDPLLVGQVAVLVEDLVASQFSGSRGRWPPRSSSRTRLPDGASRCASVPPPAPLPMTMTS